MNNDTSYILSFLHLKEPTDLPPLYFVSDQFKLPNTDLYYKSQYHKDRINKIYNVLNSIKGYFNEDYTVVINHIDCNNNKICCSQYGICNGQWVFLDIDNNEELNILNLLSRE